MKTGFSPESDQIRITFLYTHPIQYFAPLVREFADDHKFLVTVLYCSTKGVDLTFDQEFNQKIRWDIPLLEGYKYHFLKNFGHFFKKGFWSLINPGVISSLWKERGGFLVVHGWGYFTLVVALIFGKVFGYRVCLRGESPMVHEKDRSRAMLILRRLVFNYLFFSWVDYFWFIGEENRKFYKHYGVPDRKLVFTPYAVDNSRFSKESNDYAIKRKLLRQHLGIPANARVGIFCGKFIPKKRPMDLLHAFSKATAPEGYLLMIGEGEQRIEMEDFCRDNGLAKVILPGFVNQSEMGAYYAAGDFFVMCSGVGETWGLATNEAMNLYLPVLISDMTGCRANLLKEGENGFGFKTGDINYLSELLSKMFALSKPDLQEMGKVSGELIRDYSNKQIVLNVKKAIGRV